MSKKQSLKRSIALSLVLAGSIYCQVGLAADPAAPGISSGDKNESINITDQTATTTVITANGTNATGKEGDNGGNAGDVTVAGTLGADANISQNITITATAGNGGDAVHNGGIDETPVDGKTSSGGKGGNSTAGIVTEQGTLNIAAKDITITATAGSSGASKSVYAAGTDASEAIVGGAADAYGLKILSANGAVAVQNITITATAGAGGEGGRQEVIEKSYDGADGGDATASGLQIADSAQLVVTTADVGVTATGGNGNKIGDFNGNAAGNGGAAIATGVALANIGSIDLTTQALNITAIGGGGGFGGYNSTYSDMKGGIGGLAEATALQVLATTGSVKTTNITVKATGGNNDKNYVEENGGAANATAIRVVDSSQLSVDVAEISVEAKGGNYGYMGSGDASNHGKALAIGLSLTNSQDIDVTTKTINVIAKGGVSNQNKETAIGNMGGTAEAYGLKLISTKGTVTAEDIVISTEGGAGQDGGSSNSIITNGATGGYSTSYGVQSSNGLLSLTADNIQVTATGGVGGSGLEGQYMYHGSKASNGGDGGFSTGYGVQAGSGLLSLIAADIQVTATGGAGGNGGRASYMANNSEGGDGGNGGDIAAYGVQIGTGTLSLTADKIEVKAIGGAGGNGGAASLGGADSTGGKGGDGGSGIAYGVHVTMGIGDITTDSITANANGDTAGVGGAVGTGTGSAVGADGTSGYATAYGVYAAQGSVVTLAAKTSGNTLDIGVTATGTDAKAYAVYADAASVLFDSSANLNKNASLIGTDNDVITYLNNATFGFAGTDAGRTITGGTLSLQGSNTFVINTDLANNKADKISFDSLAAGSSSATQYISIGYDPALDPANLGTVDFTNNLEIFEIVNIGADQDLKNFQAKTNILDSALYKFTVTPEIIIDEAGNKIEIGGITTDKLRLPSESVMTAGDSMTGMNNLWHIEGNNLMKRMGDLRSDPEAAKGGVWARYYSGEMAAAGSYGRSLSQDYSAFQGGIDKVQDYHDGRLYTGIAINHISSNSSYSAGRGEGSSTGVGLYTSWLGNKGHYVDVILRASRMNSNFKTFTTAGLVTGDYSTWAYGLSAEYGYRHKMQAGWFVEPQAELSFGHMNGASYTMSNGAQMENGSINSATARLGFVLGKEFKMSSQPSNVYMKASLYHEFGGKGSLTGYYNTDYIHADGAPNMGTWYEVGLGANLGIAKNSNLYVDAVKTFGGKINTKWQINAGVRVSF